MRTAQTLVAIVALSLAGRTFAVSASGQCQCQLSVIAGATGMNMTSGAPKGPCGREMSLGKVVAAQTVARSAAAQGLTATELATAAIFSPELQAAAAPVTQVDVDNSFFNSNSVTINAGDTVVWNLVSGSHTVTSDDNLFDSGFLSGQFQYTFNTPGTYGYHCIFHGGAGFGGSPGFGMWGQVTVNAVVTPEPMTVALLLPATVLLGRRRPVRR